MSRSQHDLTWSQPNLVSVEKPLAGQFKNIGKTSVSGQMQICLGNINFGSLVYLLHQIYFYMNLLQLIGTDFEINTAWTKIAWNDGTSGSFAKYVYTFQLLWLTQIK